jgi:CRP/FNR family transcriptional regulator
MPCTNCDCPFQEIRALSEPDLPSNKRCMLNGSVQGVTFKHGEILFMQGQPSSCLFAISDGTVKICTHNADGREQIVGISGPHSLLVGLQSLNHDRYAYSAIAASDVRACRINHRALLETLRDRGDLAIRLIEVMTAQLAHSRALMEVLGHKCAAAKIASFLLLITPVSKKYNGNFELPFSRLEIASLLGLSEETVCRLMASMRREGAIHAPRGRLEIRDWGRLHSIADGKSGINISH